MKTDNVNSLIPNKLNQWYMFALVLSAFSVESIFRYVLIVINKLPVVSALSGLFLPAVFTILIFLNYKHWIRYRVRYSDILFVLVFYLIALLSYIIFPESREEVENRYMVLLAEFPLYYLLGVVYTSDKKTEEMLALLAKAIILIDILFTIYWQGAGNELGADAMARAYRMTPSVMFLIMTAFNRRRQFDWVWMIFAVIYLFSCGTRGPIVVIAVYIMYFLLFADTGSKKSKSISMAVFAAIVIFYNTPYFNLMLEWISDVFKEIGFSTRVFDHILEDTLVSDASGRDEIFSRVVDMLKENPFGYGILGEYSYLNWNTHNFYLQVMVHFGVIPGILIIIATLYIVIKAYIVSSSVYAKNMIIMWAIYTFVRGFAGGSYLDYNYAFMLGLCIYEIRNSKLKCRGE